MPKTTIAQACRDRGIQRQEWEEARRQGVDPWDRAAMDAWLATRRPRIKPGTQLSNVESVTAQSLDEMERAIRSATSIDDVKILKEKVMALKGIISIQIELRELIPAGEVKESNTALYSITRAELLKITSDLPPQLAGLGEAKIQAILRERILEMLAQLTDANK